MSSQLVVSLELCDTLSYSRFFLTTFCASFWKIMHNLKEIINPKVSFVLTVGYVDNKTYPLRKY